MTRLSQPLAPLLRRLPAVNPAVGLLLGAFALLASGCSPVGLAAGGTAGAGVVAAQERSVGTAIDDAFIELQISERWFRQSEVMFNALDLTVIEGRALITGFLNDPDLRVDAVRLAWQVEGVEEVINEIQLGNRGGIETRARDFRISTELRSKLTFDREVQAINYNIDTVGGVVYLMGIAVDETELTRVTNHARTIDGVARVVSYVRLLNEAPPPPLETTITDPA